MDHLSTTDLDQLTALLTACPPAESSRALAAIADGTYGSCAVCGAEVERERLMARPTLALCSDCTEELARTKGGQRIGR